MEQEVSAEIQESDENKEGEHSTHNQTEDSKPEPDPSDAAEQTVAEKNSSPSNEEAKSTNGRDLTCQVMMNINVVYCLTEVHIKACSNALNISQNVAKH